MIVKTFARNKFIQTKAQPYAEAKGYKYRAFHATREQFTVFDKNKVGRTQYPDTLVGEAYFFGVDKLTCACVAAKNADGSYCNSDEILYMDCFLKMDNPIVWNPKAWGDSDYIDTETMANCIVFAKEKGRDGIVWKSKSMGDVYVVFSPEQIKLADEKTYDDNGKEIPLESRFNENNVDIRY